MRWLVVTDIHGNLPALRRVLDTPEARSCGRCISLGDQVNFGPQSREVQEELQRLGAVMLLGNHEERFRHMEDFQGYNWAPLRWTWERMRGLETPGLTDVRIGPVWCTHGTPGNPYHLVDAETVKTVLDALPEGITLLLSGHHHIAWRVEHGGRTAVNPGSVGMYEGGRGGWAPFAVLETEAACWRLTCHAAAYDTEETRAAFLSSGLAETVPEMSRAVLQVMRTGQFHGVPALLAHVRETAALHGLSMGDRRAWRLADTTWSWEEPVDSLTFWSRPPAPAEKAASPEAGNRQVCLGEITH